MKLKLKIAAFAGIVYLVSFFPELAFETLRDLRETEWASGALLRIIYIISSLSTIVFFYGFIALANKFDNNLLLTGALILILTTLFYHLFKWYAIDAYIANERLVGGAALLLYGFSGIVFGLGLFRLRDRFGYLAASAGLLEIIAGVLMATIVLFLFGLVLTIPAIIIEILLLLKIAPLLEDETDRVAQTTG